MTTVYRTYTISLIAAGSFVIPSGLSAATVVESLTGSGAFVTPGNTGDHTGGTYSLPFSFSSGLAVISFNVSVSVGTGPVHFDTRGFGDSSGSNDALQRLSPDTETLSFNISALSVTATSGTVISDTIIINFDSFDLVHNGNNPPRVSWTDNGGNSGTTTSPGGSSGDITTESGISATATEIDITAEANWMWINNAQFSFSGDVTIETIPEPSHWLLVSSGATLLLTRRRQA